MKMKMMIVAMLAIGFMVGCGVDPKQVAANAQAYQGPTTQAIADLQGQIAALPAGDPVRMALEGKLKKAQNALLVINGTIDAVSNGTFDAAQAQDLASKTGIPYAGLAVGVFFGLTTLWQRIEAARKQQQLEQVVQGVEAIKPLDETDKAVLSAAQDKDTRAAVAQIRANLPVTAVAAGTSTDDGSEGAAA